MKIQHRPDGYYGHWGEDQPSQPQPAPVADGGAVLVASTASTQQSPAEIPTASAADLALLAKSVELVMAVARNTADRTRRLEEHAANVDQLVEVALPTLAGLKASQS